MIAWIYDSLLALHPAGVRETFGDEMRQVFLDARAEARAAGGWTYTKFCIREVVGMMSGLTAGGGWFRHQRWVAACALAGAVWAGGFVWIYSQSDYVSRAVVRLTNARIPEEIVHGSQLDPEEMNRLVQNALSRTGASQIINTLGLYPGERQRMPMESVIEQFREEMQIDFLGAARAWRVSFSYRDRVKAQAATQAVVTRMVEELSNGRRVRALETERFLDEMTAAAGQELDAAYEAARAGRQKGVPGDRLELDAAMARRHYEALREKRAAVQMLRRVEERKQGSQLEVVDPASLPAERQVTMFWPWPLVLAVLGGGAGGAITGGVSGVLGAWLLGIAPRLRRWVPAV